MPYTSPTITFLLPVASTLPHTHSLLFTRLGEGRPHRFMIHMMHFLHGVFYSALLEHAMTCVLGTYHDPFGAQSLQRTHTHAHSLTDSRPKQSACPDFFGLLSARAQCLNHFHDRVGSPSALIKAPKSLTNRAFGPGGMPWRRRAPEK